MSVSLILVPVSLPPTINLLFHTSPTPLNSLTPFIHTHPLILPIHSHSLSPLHSVISLILSPLQFTIVLTPSHSLSFSHHPLFLTHPPDFPSLYYLFTLAYPSYKISVYHPPPSQSPLFCSLTPFFLSSLSHLPLSYFRTIVTCLNLSLTLFLSPSPSLYRPFLIHTLSSLKDKRRSEGKESVSADLALYFFSSIVWADYRLCVFIHILVDWFSLKQNYFQVIFFFGKKTLRNVNHLAAGSVCSYQRWR